MAIRSASHVLDQEFLQVRAKILEIAAFYDRLESAGGVPNDSHGNQHMQMLRQGCEILTDDQDNKAARIQLLFSREYDSDWRSKFGL